MIASRIKTIVFTVLALILSVGHSYCAELAAFATAQSVVEQSAMGAHHAHGQADDPNHHGAHHGGAPQEPIAAHAPCGPSQSTCDHCEAAQFYKAASVNFLISLPAMTVYPAPARDIAAASESIASSASPAIAYRQQGPPGETPVSLKTKLLT